METLGISAYDLLAPINLLTKNSLVTQAGLFILVGSYVCIATKNNHYEKHHFLETISISSQNHPDVRLLLRAMLTC